MKRQNEETGARYPMAYTTGKGEVATIRKPCKRSCVEGQGPQTMGYCQQPALPLLAVGPWTANHPPAPVPGASAPREGKLVRP
jgi:hypothetical protein